MGGGGGGSQDVPPPPLGTQYAFQNQPGADIGAYSGTGSIANNSFYPNPNMSSFLFPGGVNYGGNQLIAPMGQPPPAPPAPPPQAPAQNTSFLTPQDAQTILQGGYATLAPSVQAQVQSMAGMGGPSIFGTGGGGAGPTMDQSLAWNLMRSGGGNVANLDPNSLAQLQAIAYGGGGGGGGGSTTPVYQAGSAQSMAQGGGGYQGGSANYAPYGPQGVGGVVMGGNDPSGLSQQAIDQGGIGGGGTMNFSYPGAAAYLGLGPQIAGGAINNQKIMDELMANIGGSQAQAGNVGSTLEGLSINNPNTNALNQTGNQFLQMGQGNPVSNALYNTSGGFLAQSQDPALQQFEGQTLNTGFDPQQSLYDRTLQQTTDQTRAGLEARGLDMTPYGAGVESDALRNFNIDWQNTQLARQGQAATNANTLAGMQSGLANTGTSLAQAGSGIQNQFAQTGGSLIGQGATDQAALAKAGSEVLGQNVMGQGMISDLSQAGLGGYEGALTSLQGGAQGAYAQPQQAIQDYLSYLTAATGQNSVNASIYGSQLQAANQQQANSNAMSLGLLSGIGGLVGK